MTTRKTDGTQARAFAPCVDPEKSPPSAAASHPLKSRGLRGTSQPHSVLSLLNEPVGQQTLQRETRSYGTAPAMANCYLRHKFSTAHSTKQAQCSAV